MKICRAFGSGGQTTSIENQPGATRNLGEGALAHVWFPSSNHGSKLQNPSLCGHLVSSEWDVNVTKANSQAHFAATPNSSQKKMVIHVD
ncbi:hypothetical protein AVEN_5538-1 [Araneus ventricosus]|uniref:Uncharacterized protein n=1 Tax=Araneus ventricosus TaxID=182803 RepID=A0A4Y2DWS2_ARAVE|nr:hypothetical protein AVEN_5538-1 [Araneus ventricosus]